MDRYNNGIIYTNENCIGCNKCISNCSLMGANVSIVKDGKVRMEIDPRKCNDCGRCINICVHHARDFRDDTDKFFKALQKGEKISVILEPSFYAIYGEKAPNIISCLRSLGVDKIYDGSFGREICAYLTAKYLKEAKSLPVDQRCFISNACPAMVTVVEKYHPFLLSKMIPVQPAAVCSAIYAHKYLGDENKIACLGTCIANKDEVISDNTGGVISYNITFAHVMEKLKKYKFEDYTENGEADLKGLGLGSVVSVGGEFSDIISVFFSNTETILALQGFSKDNISSLYMSLDEKYKANQPLFAEITACKSGCIGGPGVSPINHDIGTIYSNAIAIRTKAFESYSEIDSPEKFWKMMNTRFKYIRPEDFKRSYTDLSRQQFKIPQSAFDEIFNDMLKDTPQKRSINCGSCGYSSCQDMARAIAYGYSRKESCIHYMNDLLEKRYYTDSETGLMNRDAFVQAGSRMLNENPEISYIIAVGDVNKLKIINDLYGFEAGNDALRKIAATLRQIVGDKGLVARLGGGAFVVCMENSVDNLQRLQSCKVFDNGSLHMSFPITMHFGIRIATAAVGLTTAMDQASLCMDYNISSVQNTYTAFTEKNIEKTHLEAEVTSQMQQALDAGEFKIWFQPQYSSTTGDMVGAEVLCRWIKEDGSITSPGVFIPIAEKNGFIRMLDEEIWTNVFAAVRSWLDVGIEPVPLSINISRISLESDKLYYIIKRLKEKYNIPQKYIHFEITESASVNSQMNLNSRIQKIRDLGFLIAMDDFGSGYSSLNSLKDMPIDILKLDMGFMRGYDNMNRGGTILNYVVRMAQGLEYITVAEGVETQEQADFLRSIGVNIFQGYLYAKPMPEDKFVDLLKKSKKKVSVIAPRTFGQIDVRKFLTPDSSESLMFEDYTGPAAIYEFDVKTHALILIRANRKFLNLFEMEELTFSEIRNNLKKLMGKEAFATLIEKSQEYISEQKEVTCYMEMRTYVKHSPIWIKNHLWEISHNGQKHYFYILIEDITSEKITESTLEISNSQLGMLMDNSQVGLCLMHVNVSFKHIIPEFKTRFLRVNQTFLDISGYSEEEVLSWTEKEGMNVIHPDDRAGFMKITAKAFLNKFRKPYTYDYRAVTKDGKYSNVRIVATGIQQPDKSFMLITNYILLD